MRSDSRKNCKNKKIEDPPLSEIHEQFDLLSLLKGKQGNSMLDENSRTIFQSWKHVTIYSDGG